MYLKTETRADRLLRLRANYEAHGMRSCVAAVIVVELFKHPHLLLLQVQNSFYRLPGGRLLRGESDTDCLIRKLSSKLSAGEDGRGPEWEVGECLGMWWRPDFESLLYPYLPPNIKRPKECIKLYLVKLQPSRRLSFLRTSDFSQSHCANFMRTKRIPLQTYGPVVSGVPQLLSKYSFNMVEPET
ncbi:pre-mRNA cleavage factor Im 25 kDa subunit 1-like isoform X1 [Salvia splendens]|uniref:pre-mRNA cleavage factor Im 25 kDa subunit 1-like isoform X1 n=1 Tax=Salvia splendens TaxID=180675 RepID=UPI001C27C1CB|nr:pre-mRNA cleavage factor Im 25 kDa subunit 1-like isoform X1 [Salvia splendens]